jgi:parvulin-like peptidyl-prolyl isomerase
LIKKGVIFLILWSKIAVPEVIDRIVAVVGNRVITYSELEEIQFMFPNIPQDLLLQELINRELLIIEATKDTSIRIKEDKVYEMLEKTILTIKGKFPSDKEYEKELKKLGITEEELREKYKEKLEKELMVEEMFNKRFRKELMITDLEVMKFYEDYKDSIREEPDAVKGIEVFIPYIIGEEGKEEAWKRVEKIRERVAKKGEDFNEIAEKESDDPITKERGGKLGLIEKRDLDPTLREKIEEMKKGDMKVITKEKEYQLIRLDEVYEDYVELSVIVIKFYPTKKESLKTMELVEKVKNKMKKVEKLEPIPGVEIISSSDGIIPLYTLGLNNLDEVVLDSIYVIPTPTGYQVVKAKELRPKYKPSWEELRENLKQIIYQKKREECGRRILERIRGKVYIKIM